MRIAQTTLALVATLGLTVGAACASSPEIPEESDQKTSYESAKSDQTGGEASSSSQQSASKTQGSTAQSGQSAKQKPGELPKATGPVATVNGEPIPAKKFNEEIQKVAKTGKFPVALLQKFKGRLIEKLIDRQLVDDAIESSSVEVSEKEIDQKLEDVRSKFERAAKERSKQSGGKAPGSLEEVASRYGIDKEELRDSIRRSIALEKLLVQKRDVQLPTDEETRKFYDNNKDRFTRPEQVRVRHIMIRVKPKADEAAWKKAKKKLAKIRKKAVDNSKSFAKLAKTHSDSRTAKKGGDVGFIGRGKGDNKFAKAAFDLKKGEISKPVKMRNGWHIIKLVDRRKSKTVPFEKVKGQLAEQLKNQRIRKTLEKYVEKLRADAEIKKHPENVE